MFLNIAEIFIKYAVFEKFRNKTESLKNLYFYDFVHPKLI